MAAEIWIALITSLAALAIVVVKVWSDKRKNGQYRYNPHAPGEAAQCKAHEKALVEMDKKLDKVREDVAHIKGRLNGRANRPQ